MMNFKKLRIIILLSDILIDLEKSLRPIASKGIEIKISPNIPSSVFSEETVVCVAIYHNPPPDNVLSFFENISKKNVRFIFFLTSDAVEKENEEGRTFKKTVMEEYQNYWGYSIIGRDASRQLLDAAREFFRRLDDLAPRTI